MRAFTVNRRSERILLPDFKSFSLENARQDDRVKFVHKLVSTYDLSGVPLPV